MKFSLHFFFIPYLKKSFPLYAKKNVVVKGQMKNKKATVR